MVRIAGATGIPIDSGRVHLMSKAVDELELLRFSSSLHTPKLGFFQGLLAPFLRSLSLSKLRR